MFIWKMRVVHGLWLLLLCLCGVRGQDGGLGPAFSNKLKEAEDPAAQASLQADLNMWEEIWAIRGMVVELQMELSNMEVRLKEGEAKMNNQSIELAVTKLHVEQLQKENAAQATEITALQTRLTASESRTSALEKENEDLETRVGSSESELLNSKSRIDQLEEENTDLETRVRSSESELLNSKSRIDQLEEENTDLKSRMRSSESELLNSKSRIDQLEQENTDLKTRVGSSESGLLNTKSRIDQLERENTVEKVAFYAGFHDRGRFGPFNTAVTLKYSKVFTNTGSAYDPATGFFTAPVRGVYYFQFTVFGFHACNIGVSMYKNGHLILINWEKTQEGTPEFLTNSVILELAAGDEIHLVLPSGYQLYDNGGNYSTFSGSLLFLL